MLLDARLNAASARKGYSKCRGSWGRDGADSERPMHSTDLQLATMTIWVNTYHSKRNPYGGWEQRTSIEEIALRSTATKPRSSRTVTSSSSSAFFGELFCWCCLRENTGETMCGICSACRAHVTCWDCGKRFDPCLESSWRFCKFCWTEILDDFFSTGGRHGVKHLREVVARIGSSKPICRAGSNQ